MTNAFALASASFAVLSLVAGTALWAGANHIGTAVSLVSLIATLFELMRSRQLVTSAPLPNPDGNVFRFPYEKGLIGGVFGGVVAAPIIGLAFLPEVEIARPIFEGMGQHVPSNINLFIEILVASVAIAVVLGLISLGMALYFDHLRKQNAGIGIVINKFTGGIIGGLLAGLITGPLGTLYFGLQPLPVLQPETMLLGALPATGVVVFSILNYDRKRFDGRTLKKLLLALAATGTVSVVAAIALVALGPEVADYLQKYVVTATRSGLLTGGLYYGAFVGLFLGAVVGLTLLMSRESTAD